MVPPIREETGGDGFKWMVQPGQSCLRLKIARITSKRCSLDGIDFGGKVITRKERKANSLREEWLSFFIMGLNCVRILTD